MVGDQKGKKESEMRTSVMKKMRGQTRKLRAMRNKWGLVRRWHGASKRAPANMSILSAEGGSLPRFGVSGV